MNEILEFLILLIPTLKMKFDEIKKHIVNGTNAQIRAVVKDN